MKTKFWTGFNTVSGEEFEVQSTTPDNYLLYRTRYGTSYYAGSYESIADIEDRFGITLEED